MGEFLNWTLGICICSLILALACCPFKEQNGLIIGIDRSSPIWIRLITAILILTTTISGTISIPMTLNRHAIQSSADKYSRVIKARNQEFDTPTNLKYIKAVKFNKKQAKKIHNITIDSSKIQHLTIKKLNQLKFEGHIYKERANYNSYELKHNLLKHDNLQTMDNSTSISMKSAHKYYNKFNNLDNFLPIPTKWNKYYEKKVKKAHKVANKYPTSLLSTNYGNSNSVTNENQY